MFKYRMSMNSLKILGPKIRSLLGRDLSKSIPSVSNYHKNNQENVGKKKHKKFARNVILLYKINSNDHSTRSFHTGIEHPDDYGTVSVRS